MKISKGDCDYCRSKDVDVRPTYFLSDTGSNMCRECWDFRADKPVEFRDTETIF